MSDTIETGEPINIKATVEAVYAAIDAQEMDSTPRLDRKLATIRKVAAIEPIPNADKIELVHIDGWQCVAQKGTYKVGELVCYFEVDSFLPVQDCYEFLRKGCFRSSAHLGDGFRIKTMKMRGTLSQGLLMPLAEVLPDMVATDYMEGADLTETLGVKKWEPPPNKQLSGIAKGNFPHFIRKTDQERAQNCLASFKWKRDEEEWFYATLKLDGSSMTAYLKDDVFGVCSRNLDLLEDEGNTFWKVARKLKLEEKLRALGRNIAIQGELMGPGVQGNREQLPDHDLYVFNIWDIDNQTYLPHPQMVELLMAHVQGVNTVPYLFPMQPLKNTIEELLAVANRKSLNHAVAEGIVLQSGTDPNVSFKVINNEFLLSEK